MYVCMCETRYGWIGMPPKVDSGVEVRDQEVKAGDRFHDMIVIFGSGPDVYAPSYFTRYLATVWPWSGHGRTTICLSYCLTFFRNLRQPLTCL